jgi:hypothetical protein
LTERHLTQDFRVSSIRLRKGTETHGEIYFLQQQYKMPTPLLDWSINPLAALFFATCSDDRAPMMMTTANYSRWMRTVEGLLNTCGQFPAIRANFIEAAVAMHPHVTDVRRCALQQNTRKTHALLDQVRRGRRRWRHGSHGELR